MSLLTVVGNFLEDAYSIEAYEFREESGDYAGLFVPSHTLAVTGSGDAITRPSGIRGLGVRFNGGEYLSAAASTAWNSLAAANDTLCIDGWFKFDDANDTSIVLAGVWGTSNAQRQWRLRLDVQLGDNVLKMEAQNSSGTLVTAQATDNLIQPGVWHHITGQIQYNGLSGGSASTTARLTVDGTEFDSSAGVVVPTAVTTPSLTIGQADSTVYGGFECDQLIFWKSGIDYLDSISIADLDNGGSAIVFAGRGRGADRSRARSRSRASDPADYT